METIPTLSMSPCRREILPLKYKNWTDCVLCVCVCVCVGVCVCVCVCVCVRAIVYRLHIHVWVFNKRERKKTLPFACFNANTSYSGYVHTSCNDTTLLSCLSCHMTRSYILLFHPPAYTNHSLHSLRATLVVLLN